MCQIIKNVHLFDNDQVYIRDAYRPRGDGRALKGPPYYTYRVQAKVNFEYNEVILLRYILGGES
jgi:hypothetical protein